MCNKINENGKIQHICNKSSPIIIIIIRKHIKLNIEDRILQIGMICGMRGIKPLRFDGISCVCDLGAQSTIGDGHEKSFSFNSIHTKVTNNLHAI